MLGTSKGSVKIYNIRTKSSNSQIDKAFENAHVSMATLSKDQKFLFVRGGESLIRVFDLVNNAEKLDYFETLDPHLQSPSTFPFQLSSHFSRH